MSGLEVRADDIRRGWHQVSKNLAQSCIGMDRAVRAVMDKYEQAKTKTSEKQKTPEKNPSMNSLLRPKAILRTMLGKFGCRRALPLLERTLTRH